MPRINGDEADLAKFKLPDKYICIQVGSTAPSRAITAEAVNQIAQYFLGRGIFPVFLGTELMHEGKYRSTFARGINWELGLDLVNQTSSLEAACILARSQGVFGIDGGLLHLAACSDAKVVMGMTIASPDKRRPLSRNVMMIQPQGLDCLGCQEHMKYIPGHHFKFCIYNDYKCCKGLTANLFTEAWEILSQ